MWPRSFQRAYVEPMNRTGTLSNRIYKFEPKTVKMNGAAEIILGGFWDFNSRQDFRRATPIENSVFLFISDKGKEKIH